MHQRSQGHPQTGKSYQLVVIVCVFSILRSRSVMSSWSNSMCSWTKENSQMFRLWWTREDSKTMSNHQSSWLNTRRSRSSWGRRPGTLSRDAPLMMKLTTKTCSNSWLSLSLSPTGSSSWSVIANRIRSSQMSCVSWRCHSTRMISCVSSNLVS